MSDQRGDALRALRRVSRPILTGASGKGWRLATISQAELAKSDGWKIIPENVERALRRLNDLGMTKISDIFDVRQGIRTGLAQAFLLSKADLDKLPNDERRFFKPAIFRDSIDRGVAREKYFVFFPYKDDAPIFAEEVELKAQLPHYFARYLNDNKPELKKRSGINQTDRPWWSLSRYYRWVSRSQPKILSKYFGGPGAFAVDETSKFIPVQAHAWIPKRPGPGRTADAFGLNDKLYAYWALLNSPTFAQLLSIFSPNRVAGGQFNLSPRFVNSIPIPHLVGPEMSSLIAELVVLNTSSDILSSSWLERADGLARLAWGSDLFDALKDNTDV